MAVDQKATSASWGGGHGPHASPLGSALVSAPFDTSIMSIRAAFQLLPRVSSHS